MTERTKPRVGQTGVLFELQALEPFLVGGSEILMASDLTDPTVQIEFNNDDGASIIKTATKELRGVVWWVSYQDSVSTSMLTVSGCWTMRIIATYSSGEIRKGSPETFEVGE